MLTGTERSLKAVVMKQPKVSAAITLSEKAKSELARVRTVFISPPSLQPSRHTRVRASNCPLLVLLALRAGQASAPE